MRRGGWTEHDDATLRRVIATGRMSFEDAAIMLGRTRNACAGRAHRLGIVSPKRPAMEHKPVLPLKGKPNVKGLHARSVERSIAGRETLDMFAARLALHGDPQRAAAEIGRSPLYGYNLLKQLQRGLGAQAT